MIIDQAWTQRQVHQHLRKLLNSGACYRLLDALARPGADFAQIAEVIQAEPYLAMRLMALANLSDPDREPIHSIQRAVQVLGLRQVHMLALSALLIAMMADRPRTVAGNKAVWRWVLASAVAADWLAGQAETHPASQTATDQMSPERLIEGLCLTFGVLVLRAGLGRDYEAVLGRPLAPMELARRERDQLDVDHHQVSYWAMGAVHCPLELCEPLIGFNEGGRDARAMRGWAIERLGARIAGCETDQAETWLIDALPRLGINPEALLDELPEMAQRAEQLTATLEMDLGDWPSESPVPLMVGAGQAMQSLLLDNLTLSHCLGATAGEVATQAAARDLARREADSDSLTEVLNRRGIETFVAQCECPDDQRVGLLLLDVDWFKQINDRMGHLAGDRCLRTVARTLDQMDPVPLAVARMGGDEFTALLSIDSLEQMRQACESLRQRLREAIIRQGEPASTLSLGGVLTTWHRLRVDWAGACAQADHQLYLAKQSGRDRAELVDSLQA